MKLLKLMLVLCLLSLPSAAQADTMAAFSFGVSGQDYGTGYINSRGVYVHNGSIVNTASIAEDGVLGRMTGFSDFSIFEATGTDTITAGTTYTVADDFGFLYFDDLRIFGSLPDDPYWDFNKSVAYSAPLTLSTISFSEDGKHMTLTGTLDNWVTGAEVFDSELMKLIMSYDSADFTLVVAASSSMVDFLSSGQGGKLSTWVEEGTISAGGQASAPEPPTLLLLSSLLPLGWVWRRRIFA